MRVQWSRADEHGWDPKGPPTLIDLRASLDGFGTVTAWDSEFFMPQQTPNMFVVPLVAYGSSGGRRLRGQGVRRAAHCDRANTK